MLGTLLQHLTELYLYVCLFRAHPGVSGGWEVMAALDMGEGKPNLQAVEEKLLAEMQSLIVCLSVRLCVYTGVSGGRQAHCVHRYGRGQA